MLMLSWHAVILGLSSPRSKGGISVMLMPQNIIGAGGGWITFVVVVWNWKLRPDLGSSSWRDVWYDQTSFYCYYSFCFTLQACLLLLLLLFYNYPVIIITTAATPPLVTLIWLYEPGSPTGSGGCSWWVTGSWPPAASQQKRKPLPSSEVINWEKKKERKSFLSAHIHTYTQQTALHPFLKPTPHIGTTAPPSHQSALTAAHS